MFKIITILSSFAVLLMLGCTDQKFQTIPLTQNDGYGPFQPGQSILIDLVLLHEDTSGISCPEYYGNISLRNFHTNYDQYLFQGYKAGRFQKDWFLSYIQKNGIDTTGFTETFVDEGVLMGITEKDDHTIVIYVDTDNDEDLSEERPQFYRRFNSVEEEVAAIDTLKTIEAHVEYYDGTHVKDITIDIRINPYKGRLQFGGSLADYDYLAASISGYRTGLLEVQGSTYHLALINDNLTSVYNRANTKILLSFTPDEAIPVLNSNSTIYKIGDRIHIGETDIKFASISPFGNTLIIEKLGESLIPHGLEISYVAPNILWTDLQNKNFDLSSLRGHYVLLDFWGTWCNPCIAKIPNLRKAYKQYHEAGFEIVSIAVDQDIQKVKTFVQDHDMPWVHLFQAFQDTSEIAPAHLYKVDSFPTTIFIDPHGKILAKNLHGQKIVEEIGKYLP